MIFALFECTLMEAPTAFDARNGASYFQTSSPISLSLPQVAKTCPSDLCQRRRGIVHDEALVLENAFSCRYGWVLDLIPLENIHAVLKSSLTSTSGLCTRCKRKEKGWDEYQSRQNRPCVEGMIGSRPPTGSQTAGGMDLRRPTACIGWPLECQDSVWLSSLVSSSTHSASRR